MKHKKYRVKDEIAWRKMKDGTVTIVSPIIDKIISVNETAGMIFELLDGTNSVEMIVDFMCDKFSENENVLKEDIQTDVLEIIDDFNERELLDELIDNI